LVLRRDLHLDQRSGRFLGGMDPVHSNLSVLVLEAGEAGCYFAEDVVLDDWAHEVGTVGLRLFDERRAFVCRDLVAFDVQRDSAWVHGLEVAETKQKRCDVIGVIAAQ
jgi:hypothetical protein